MDVVESIKRNKHYIKCKLIVKSWEKEFKTKHSRTPSKLDIKEAPTKIKYAYKKYFQLKSEALENSLSICDYGDEPLGSPEPIQNLELMGFSPLLEQSLPALPTGQELEQMLSTAQSKDCLPHSGSALNLETTSKVKPLSPFSDNLSKKLFQNRKFSIRNPRKSMSKSQSFMETISCDIQNSKHEDVSLKSPSKNLTDPSFSSSYVDKEPKFNNSISTHINIDHSIATNSVRLYDEAWIERATGMNLKENVKIESGNEIKDSFGLRNITISKISDKVIDVVENSESEEEITIEKLKPALKKRKLDTSVQDKSVVNINQSYSNENVSKPKMKKGLNTTKSKKKVKQMITHKNIVDDLDTQKQPPEFEEFVPFNIEKDIAPRHSNVKNILKSVQSPKIKNEDNIEESKLEKKIQNGTLNENYVKINIEKKVFVRGKKNISYSKHKKKLWKDKKALHAGMEFPESGQMLCFKCGKSGHMARYCSAHKGDTLLPLESYDDNDIPTLEDMKDIVSKETNKLSIVDQLSQSIYEPSQVPHEFLKLLDTTTFEGDNKPVFNNIQNVDLTELYDGLKMFGHDSFRSGQKEAITRVLSGLSTLLILPTGGGKSLCYQLPAYIYSKHSKCITLVISPLVSLMEDQVVSMPEFLKAGCLHTNQPPTQRQKILEYVKDGLINILLISPEALISGDTSKGISGLFKSLPKIAFACIDEAHCVSQWSHNFRPSYLMICRVLREKLNVRCILGLTATASRTTVESIITHINIPDGMNGVVTNPALPDNLFLSVSNEDDKDRALLSYITTERISSFHSIIVYCIRRDECVRVAALLRSCLQQPGKVNMEKSKKRKRMSYISEAYHAGMSGAQRKKIQKNFMDGTLRIIVATVAFGMGINKPDIRCIIHYNMPSSFESYVQEVGRAGRDSLPAYCHVFMNNSSIDKNELLKHIHANTIDRAVIRKLLQKVFTPCECGQTHDEENVSTNSNYRKCKGHEVGIPIESTVEELDIPAENIATLLCYIELHSKHYIKYLTNAYTVCKISSYGGPQKILEAAKTCPPLAMAFLLESKKDPNIAKNSILEFPVIEVAAAIGWESGITKYKLKNLEWTVEGGVSKRSQLKVEFNTLGFRIRAPGDLTPTELDSILDDLHTMVVTQEKTSLHQLEESNLSFKKIGNYSLQKCSPPDDILLEKSNELKQIIRNYFERESLTTAIELEERPLDTERVISDIRALIACYKDCNFTGRSIARIFQGISSPNYPAIVWGRTKFWRSHIHEDFYGIIKIATQQIIQMR